MALCHLPAGERLVRFRQRWVDHLLVHASVGGQLDDVAIRVAEIDRPAEAVVDRSAHFHGAVATLFEHALEHVVVNGECYMQVEAVLLLGPRRNSDKFKILYKLDCGTPLWAASNPSKRATGNQSPGCNGFPA